MEETYAKYILEGDQFKKAKPSVEYEIMDSAEVLSIKNEVENKLNRLAEIEALSKELAEESASVKEWIIEYEVFIPEDEVEFVEETPEE